MRSVSLVAKPHTFAELIFKKISWMVFFFIWLELPILGA